MRLYKMNFSFGIGAKLRLHVERRFPVCKKQFQIRDRITRLYNLIFCKNLSGKQELNDRTFFQTF
uniref:Uncharacterized protein n=1 Tax=Leptospira santarosai serovar Arenal str. MAVJ 401 TaxID=1049976 RepID=M6JEF7_9LEPT|nr:hypothetical protein LEP1GSC063_2137 [Leptospira santarosai serovar Arenal str. MAVJ 401]